MLICLICNNSEDDYNCFFIPCAYLCTVIACLNMFLFLHGIDTNMSDIRYTLKTTCMFCVGQNIYPYGSCVSYILGL